MKPDASYRSLTATFLALLECGFVAQAQALAGSLPWRRLSSALLAVLQVEVAHHAGGALEEGRSARIALERRIDVASAEIEACIAALVRTPHTRRTRQKRLRRTREVSQPSFPDRRVEALATGMGLLTQRKSSAYLARGGPSGERRSVRAPLS